MTRGLRQDGWQPTFSEGAEPTDMEGRPRGQRGVTSLPCRPPQRLETDWVGEGSLFLGRPENLDYPT